MDIERRYLKRIDWAILFVLVALAVYSYIGISGANAQFGEEKKQIVWYAIGFGAMFAVLLFDYKWIGQLAYGLYGFGIVLLVLVLLFGTETNGAVSWFAFGPVKIQPSEFMKLFVILALARYLASREEEGDAPLQSASGLLTVIGMVALPVVLILKQPDLGTALVFCGILLSVLLVGGAPCACSPYWASSALRDLAFWRTCTRFIPRCFSRSSSRTNGRASWHGSIRIMTRSAAAFS
ncbi:FtsW/RodA/SpoVE family cell cycle protein [Calditerricola satsumensis]|uniref:FtsW/RodA/SpoVE family cell cycle protein n=1 Tax=Calditerricola satsumensis TaxID=373054 RepID=UPI00210F2175|nr:FtsW/RodA/SpoVE family cell cycle protein [Calditerricola satsumensis]